MCFRGEPIKAALWFTWRGGWNGGGALFGDDKFTHSLFATAGIPPNATLCFEIEILSIREGEAS